MKTCLHLQYLKSLNQLEYGQKRLIEDPNFLFFITYFAALVAFIFCYLKVGRQAVGVKEEGRHAAQVAGVVTRTRDIFTHKWVLCRYTTCHARVYLPSTHSEEDGKESHLRVIKCP
ncbi:hypothetical protein GOODEAATRI_011978 [Goodea atripinnis]|uniref:Uncharacterized protein n=1 Tax=Goodea atripinnis TaxID=208336 RepID=A0ABV0PXA4_9TELE